MVYNFNINKEGKIKGDKTDYILSFIHLNQYIDNTCKDRWVNVNQELLREIVGKGGVSILKDLVKDGYVECDDICKKGSKSFGYRINYDMVPKKGIKRIENKYYNKTVKRIENNNLKRLDDETLYIIEMTKSFFNQGKIGFGEDTEKVKRMINSFRKDSYDKYYSQKVLVDRIISGDIVTVADKQGARIYTNYSNLSRDIRKWLKIEGKDKVCIDIKNSQIQTLCLTLMEKFPNLKEASTKRFYEIVFDGKIYDYVVDRLVSKGDNRPKLEIRDDVKVHFLNWLYAENVVSFKKKEIQYLNNLIKEDFNEIYNIIYQIKKGKLGGSRLARKMQWKESSIIKRIQYDLLMRGIVCISLHDSLYFRSDIDVSILDEVNRRLTEYGYGKTSIEYDNISKVREDQNKRIRRSLENKEYMKEYLGIEKRDISNSYMMGTNITIKDNNNLPKQKSIEDELINHKLSSIDDYFKQKVNDFLKTT